MKTTCVFTGHRQLDEYFDESKLGEFIYKFLQEGVSTFYNGGAIGFDLLAAEIVLSFKSQFPNVKLIVCSPCERQDKYFTIKEKKRYQTILSKADEVLCLSDHYYRGCMQVRDRYMVEKSDCMITYCTRSEGGTAYTVRYFKKIRPEGEILYV